MEEKRKKLTSASALLQGRDADGYVTFIRSVFNAHFISLLKFSVHFLLLDFYYEQLIAINRTQNKI